MEGSENLVPSDSKSVEVVLDAAERDRLIYLPGKKFTGKPVYVLTSGQTFSTAAPIPWRLTGLTAIFYPNSV